MKPSIPPELIAALDPLLKDLTDSYHQEQRKQQNLDIEKTAMILDHFRESLEMVTSNIAITLELVAKRIESQDSNISKALADLQLLKDKLDV